MNKTDDKIYDCISESAFIIDGLMTALNLVLWKNDDLTKVDKESLELMIYPSLKLVRNNLYDVLQTEFDAAQLKGS